MATFDGQEWNQSTDTWTALDQDDLVSGDYVEWNQSTDSWLSGGLLIAWDGSDLSGAGTLTSNSTLYIVVSADLAGTGTLTATSTIWTPTATRIYTVPEDNRTYTVPEDDRTYTVPS